MLKKFRWYWLLPLVLLLSIGIYYLPPVHSRLAWRVDNLRTRINYLINPPDRAVFVPTQTVNFESVLATTRANYAKTLTPQPTERTPLPGPTLPPTITPTPLPARVSLNGVKYENQLNRWNYCGPANFSMALTFWGWKGNRDVIGKAVMPGNTGADGLPANKDKNVMPYEFQDYIAENVPGMASVMRYGGDIDLLKRLLAAGFPVVAEKGYYERDYTGKVSWMGHYQFVTGYDDQSGELIVQDTYNDGPNFHIKYEEFLRGWRSFNYLFVVVYPQERENEVFTLLGNLADADEAAAHALAVAQEESQNLTGSDQFFAWFNLGTSHVALRQYADAASAYDYAFNLYAALGDDQSTRPYRIMWYQTGPYWAYYYTGRYADVIGLANTTLQETISEPLLEESLLWRGRAYVMAGQRPAAIADFRAALKIHPHWQPAIQALQDLGIQP